ncbi:MAG: hypothetical protein OEZ58_19960 [Gammaproteobacteria bacterium]|nr:hypothetical protein [Gammaproteobacteria bacterium]
MKKNAMQLVVLVIAFFSITSVSRAELEIRLPVADLPFNSQADLTTPSMQQSLALHLGFYQSIHTAIESRWGKRYPWWSRAAIYAIDIYTVGTPIGQTWLHEEWHRAGIGEFGMSSYNDTYNLPGPGEPVAVSHINENDLIALKRDHNANMIRKSSAGLEAQLYANSIMEKHSFFSHVETHDELLLWGNVLLTVYYMNQCAGTAANDVTQELYEAENGDLNKRDLVGMDCNAWVYDMHRPDEALSDRGTYPGGGGIDWYISWDDMTIEEKNYMKKQAKLSYLNLIDPFLLRFKRFQFTPTGHDTAINWNANVRHYMAPFGSSIDFNLFLEQGNTNLYSTLHWYQNQAAHFAGLEAELYRYPTNLFNGKLFATARIALWLQPKHLLFKTSQASPGALLGTSLSYRILKRMETFIDIDAKTAGWVAGNVYLNKNISTRLGISYIVPSF